MKKIALLSPTGHDIRIIVARGTEDREFFVSGIFGFSDCVQLTRDSAREMIEEAKSNGWTTAIASVRI